MTHQLIIFPLLIQFILAVFLIFLWNRTVLQRMISMAGSGLSIVIAVALFRRVWQTGVITLQAGNWPAPFGITFVADTFAATMVLLTAIAGLAVSVFSSGSVNIARLKFGYFPVFHFLLLGLNGAFLTGDIFNLYVWFEIIIISSFVLITIGGERMQLEGAVKYFTLNMLASIVFLTAIAVLYGLTGTLNMADLAVKVASIQNRGLVNVSALMFLVGFGIKSAVFPLYFWLPASYHTPPPAVSAIFAGLLTKVGVYALVRVFSLIFVGDPFIADVIVWVAIFTLLSGGIGALVQNNIRKVFSYLIVCHIGFMIAGLGMFTEAAFAGAVFYIVHDIVVKTNLFMVAGLIFRIKGSNSMRKLGGLYADYPKLSLLMAVPLFSLVGVPPLSGFWPKISLVLAGVDTQQYLLVGFILFASFITLFAIARLWAEVFWKKGEPLEVKPFFRYFDKIVPEKKVMMVAPVVFLAAVSIYIGFGAEHVQILSARIAGELIDATIYVQAVLGEDLSMIDQD
jgi:multicomponent Na+:H+ antiporter subunit D